MTAVRTAANACAVPFLLDPIVARLGRVVHDCLRIVVCYVVGVAAMLCGGAATDVAADVAADVARRVRLPLDYGVLSLLPPARSPAQDGRTAGSSLVNVLCLCLRSVRPSGR